MFPYDRLIYYKRIHYLFYWLIFGAIYFLIWEAITRVLGENGYTLFRVTIAFGGISGLIIFTTAMRNAFQSLLDKLENVIAPAKDYEKWSTQTVSDIFSFKLPSAKLFPLIFAIGVTSTVLIAFPPYHSNWANIIWIIALQPFFIVGGFGAHGILHLLYFLTRLSAYPIKVPLFRQNHPGVVALSLFYSYLTLVVVICYVWLITATWQSPYSRLTQSNIWLIIIGFFPLATFIWSYFRILAFARNILQTHLDIINDQVQSALKQVKKKPSKENAEALMKIMEVQIYLEKHNQLPIKIEQVLTLSTTLLAPFTQLAIDVIQKNLP